ncbi:MAG: glutamine synthetase, partial [Acidobacteria bacterium]|nr:glutamine synthetase [Acidobacteriota bacterium]
TNPWVNSYKRLNEGYEAPQHVTWARADRSALVRVPNARPGKRDSSRVEYRAVDAACNPYLAFSLMLAAGLKGIEQGLELPEESHHSAGEQTGNPRPLPKTLAEALSEAERSELVRETLGDHIFEWFLRNRWSEWEEYSRQVTAFERERYLPIW